jgi:hypothetical protein
MKFHKTTKKHLEIQIRLMKSQKEFIGKFKKASEKPKSVLKAQKVFESLRGFQSLKCFLKKLKKASTFSYFLLSCLSLLHFVYFIFPHRTLLQTSLFLLYLMGLLTEHLMSKHL